MIVAMRTRLDLVGLAVTGLVGLAVAFTPPVSSGAVPTPLRTFVAVSSSGKIALYSSLTGERVKTLATSPSHLFTDNGLAYAPDGSSVYFTLIPSRRERALSLRLMRLDVQTGRQRFVADGAQPALSNDGNSWPTARSRKAWPFVIWLPLRRERSPSPGWVSQRSCSMPRFVGLRIDQMSRSFPPVQLGSNGDTAQAALVRNVPKSSDSCVRSRPASTGAPDRRVRPFRGASAWWFGRPGWEPHVPALCARRH